MDDRQIEEMLRTGWDPRPPDGMRERVLNQAIQAGRSTRGRLVLPRWQVAIACLGILSIATAGGLDHVRAARIAALSGQQVDSQDPGPAGTPDIRGEHWLLAMGTIDNLRLERGEL